MSTIASMRTRLFRAGPAWFAVFCLLLVSPTDKARGASVRGVQEPGTGLPRTIADPEEPADSAGVTASTETKRLSPFLAPIPSYNPTFGWGIGALAGIIHRFDNDPKTPASMGGALGSYYQNRTSMFGLMENAYLPRDRWRVQAMVMRAAAFYDFYGIGQQQGEEGDSIPLRQDVTVAFTSVLRKIFKRAYVGPKFAFTRTKVGAEDAVVPPQLQAPLADKSQWQNVSAAGFKVQWDARDNTFYPTKGLYGTWDSAFSGSDLGSDTTYELHQTSLRGYFSPWDPAYGVLAVMEHAQVATGDPPFYRIPSIGMGQTGLRGYLPGRYRDNVLLQTQGEWRWKYRRFGTSLFGGFAQMGPVIGQTWSAKVMPAGGFGLRYQLMKKETLNTRVDLAWGRDGFFFYFGVGEAF